MIRLIAIIDENQFSLEEYVDAEGGRWRVVSYTKARERPTFLVKIVTVPSAIVSKKLHQSFVITMLTWSQKKKEKNKGHKLETRL